MNRSFARPGLAFVAVVRSLAPRLAFAQDAPPPAAPPAPPPPMMVPAPVFAPAGPAPSTGVAFIVVGSVFTGIGALNLITAPICETSVIPRATQGLCLGASLVFAGITLAIGVPLLAVGVSKRGKYKEWKESHGVVARLTDLGVAPLPGGAVATWQTAF
jgi:hypothetical protein